MLVSTAERTAQAGAYGAYGVWSVGPKLADRKSENDRAEILPHSAENCQAKNTIRSKKYSSIISVLLLTSNSLLVSRLF